MRAKVKVAVVRFGKRQNTIGHIGSGKVDDECVRRRGHTAQPPLDGQVPSEAGK